MSFAENLQTLRKINNLTQDDLAEKLDVTRQAVSKWESGGGYPEMEKLMVICDMFGYDIDTLLKGKISENKNKDKNEYEKIFNSMSTAYAFAVGLILLGVTLLVTIACITGENEKAAMLGVALLFCCIAVSVTIFIMYGMRIADFKRKHPVLPDFYSDDEISSYNKTFAILISAGVALILSGIAAMLISYVISEAFADKYGAIFVLAGITLGVPLLVFAGIRKGKQSIEDYNSENHNRKETLSDKICGVIMLTATAIFLAIGFIFDTWHPTWAVFPLGGILCAIVSTISGGGHKNRHHHPRENEDNDDKEE